MRTTAPWPCRCTREVIAAGRPRKIGRAMRAWQSHGPETSESAAAISPPGGRESHGEKKQGTERRKAGYRSHQTRDVLRQAHGAWTVPRDGREGAVAEVGPSAQGEEDSAIWLRRSRRSSRSPKGRLMTSRWIASSLLAVSMLAAVGCASTDSVTPAASPSTAQVDCEQTRGVWRAALNFCEYTAPESPTTPSIRR